MRGQIVYVKDHASSERQAQESYNSFKKNGWDVELVEGITSHTVKDTKELKADFTILKKKTTTNF